MIQYTENRMQGIWVRLCTLAFLFTRRIALLLVVFCCHTSTAQHNNKVKDFNTLSFQTLNSKIPIVKVMINGKPGWMIVDTGASITIVHAAKASYYGFKVARNDKTDLTGLGGRAVLLETYDCSLQLGELTIKQRPKAQDLHALLSMINAHDKVTIVGILGADVLSRYKMTIDYNNKLILFPAKKSENDVNVCQVPGVLIDGLYLDNN
ncbi:MAG: clan AA aspartic protease [Cyclobacteriaceae bacterium]|nr:clan AA aspartic protease [Cyclobacteriaceae bacterium]